MMTILVIYRTGMDPGDKRVQVLHQNLRNKLPSRNSSVRNRLSPCLVKGLDRLVSEQEVDSQNEDESD